MLMTEIRKPDGQNHSFSLYNITESSLHMHAAYEIVFVLRGSVELKCTIFNYPLSAGDVFIVNVKELHQFRNGSDDNLTLILHIDPYAYLGVFPNFNYYLFVCGSWADSKKQGERLNRLRHIILDLFWHSLPLNERVSAHDKVDREQKILLLINFLIDDFQDFFLDETGYHSARDPYLDSFQMARLSEIQEYIIKRYSEKIKLEDLSRHLNLNKYYVSHLITSTIGLSLTDFICLTRVEQSEALLLSTNLSIENIALQCGFSAKRYFEKHFYRWLGAMPSEYRKKRLMDSTDRYEEIDFPRVLDPGIAAILAEFAPPARGDDKKGYVTRRHFTYRVDLYGESSSFPHDWGNVVFVSNANRAMTRAMAPMLDEACGLLDVDTVRVVNFNLQDFSEADGPAPFSDPFFDYIASRHLKLELIHALSAASVEPLCESAANFFTFASSTYGSGASSHWSVVLDEVPPAGMNASRHKLVNEQFISAFSAHHPDIGVYMQPVRAVKNRYAYNSGLPAPYIIFCALNGKSTEIDMFRELCDIPALSLEERPQRRTGMFSEFGERKPSWYAWRFLSRLGNELIHKEDGFIATKKGEDYQILVYDHVNIPSGDATPHLKQEPIHLSINIANARVQYAVTKLYHNSEKNLFAHRAREKFPSHPTREEVDDMNLATIPEVSFDVIEKGAASTIHIDLNPCSSALLILRAK
jgi:AraC-like DNA-binding protein